jgi:hypothetical protein
MEDQMSALEQPAAIGTWTVSETRLGRENLSAAEVFVAIQSLTDEEQTKLLKFAILKSVQTPYDGKDLIQETLTRCLEGRRLWPRDVPVFGFLCGVMKSIASEWKEDSRPDPPVEPDPEDEAIRRIDAHKFIRLFDDDAIAQSIVISMMLGARGEELRQSSGLNEVDYESKRKKIRRRIAKYAFWRQS